MYDSISVLVSKIFKHVSKFLPTEKFPGRDGVYFKYETITYR